MNPRQVLRWTARLGVLTLALWLAACSTLQVGVETPAAPTDVVEVSPTSPAATDAPPTPTEPAPATVSAATPTPTASVGVVSGRVCYPSHSIPPMTAYFQNTQTGEYTQVAIAADQTEYSVALVPGTYTAFSWQADFQIAQGHSRMVPGADGIQIAESLEPFAVLAGQTTTGIDLCDPTPLDVVPPDFAGPPDPTGVLYTGESGLFIVQPDGGLRQLSQDPNAALSPDGARLLYVEADDIWLADLNTGERLNLTNTPERIEHSPRWWPARPDLAVFSSYAIGREIQLGPGLFPTLVSLDGTGYRILDESEDAFSLALSPDGRTLAYGAGPTTWLYDIETDQRRAFVAADYGLDFSGVPTPANWSLANPAFSPGGRTLAWMVGQFFNDGTNQVALGFFDLDEGTAFLIGYHQMPPTDGLPPPGVWSPDGQWVAYFHWSQDAADNGLWVARADGSEEHHLGAAGVAAWHPSGQWLAWTEDGQTVRAARVGQWQPYDLALPARGWLVGWR